MNGQSSAARFRGLVWLRVYIISAALSGTAAADTSGLAVATASLPPGVERVYYQATLTATNGTPPYAWATLPEFTGWGCNDEGQITLPVAGNDVTAIAAGLYHGLALHLDGSVSGWGAAVPAGVSDVVAIAAGAEHSLALRADGTVLAWGDNSHGQATVPPDLKPVMAISAGVRHSLALCSDGTVRVWGDGDYGQKEVPAGLSHVIAIAAGGYHNLVLLGNGIVIGWGYNGSGQTDVPELPEVAGIAAGCMHSLAVLANGSPVAWGENGDGQRTVPIGLFNVVAIAGGGYHSMALLADGRLVAWGNNWFGQTNVPAGLRPVRAMAAGFYHSLALPAEVLPAGLSCSANGLVSGIPLGPGLNDVWFSVSDATGGVARKTLPMLVEPNVNALPRVSSYDPASETVEMGEGSNQTFTVWATDPEAGSLTYTWTVDGMPVDGEAGSYTHAADWGSAGTSRVDVWISDEVWSNRVSVSWSLVVVADHDGDGMDDAWEVLHFGDCSHNGSDDGDGDGAPDLEEFQAGTDPAFGPVGVATAALPDGRASASYSAQLDATNGLPPFLWSVALVSPVTGWGADGYGQATPPPELTDAVAVDAGSYHNLALRRDGTVTGWGADSHGQASVPSGLANAVAVAAGGTHSLALLANGTVTAWGYNASTQASVPQGVYGVRAIAAGEEHNLALLSGGRVIAWGNNVAGQTNVPAGLSNVTAISAGAYHNLALCSNRTVTAWGFDGFGQAAVPAGLTNVTAISAGAYHSLALGEDRTVTAWGLNEDGQASVPPGLTNVVAIAAGGRHSLALCADGAVVAWGEGGAGQTAVPPGLTNVQAIAAGSEHCLVLGTGVTRLPEGLTCFPDGLVSGVPAKAGTYTVTFGVHDSGGTAASRTLILSIAPAPTNTWQGGLSSDWFDGGNWSLGTVPCDEAVVVLPAQAASAPLLTNTTELLSSVHLEANQTLTVLGWNSSLLARDIRVDGTITHASNTLATTNALGEWIPLHRVWLIGTNITLSATGKINANYRGYANHVGPGCAASGYNGAGHSGVGRRGFNGGTGGAEYGDPAAPVHPGSGGSTNGLSGVGGGAVRVEASGQLTLDGSITAHGQHALGTHGTGGTGGSIWLSCRTLLGSAIGLVGVDGGNGNDYGAGASAGRMAVIYNPDAQSALGTAFPPIRFSAQPGTRGSSSEVLSPAMGTLFLTDSRLTTSPFTNKRFQYTRWVIPEFTNWTPSSLTLNDCVIGLPDGMRLQVAGNLLLTNGAALHVFAAASSNAVTEPGAWIEVGGNLLIRSNAWIHPYAEPTNGAVVSVSVTGDLVVAAGGGIDADYKGYTVCRGPGSPSNSRGGGGYGGAGAQGQEGGRGGTAYGQDPGPFQPGSGGGQSPEQAGQGGGAISIAVGDQAVIHGLLTARGAPGVASHGPGGSGGGISLACRTFEGSASGLLRVDGGLGSCYGGSGGGGRIAVEYDPAAQAALAEPRPPVRFSAFAHPDSGAAYVYPNPAEPGSLYFRDALMLGQTPTSPAVWGGQRFWHVRLAIPGFTNWAPSSLTVSNCVVRFPDGFRLEVAQDLTLQPGAGLQLRAAETNGTGDGYGARLGVGGNLAIQSNAWVSLFSHPTNGALAGLRVVGNAVIEPGGGVDADARGYDPDASNGNGPGAGRDPSSGGGYGGRGGGPGGGVSNGLALFPVTAGSPGGWRPCGDYTTAADGGGGIHLLVGGDLVMNGTLTANGGNGADLDGAAGSGGSILVAAKRLSGMGLMRAVGGNANGVSGSGGGGRIAVWERVPLAQVDRLLLNRTATILKPMPVPNNFIGELQVGGGTHSFPGDAGTKGFYRFAPPGVLMAIY